jgi:hypothetical protein
MNNQEALLVDQSRARGQVQLGVGLFTLYQGEIKVGLVFVEAVDDKSTVEHWGLYREYRWPSALNVRQELHFEYESDGREMSGAKLRETLPAGSTYVMASCKMEVIG